MISLLCTAWLQICDTSSSPPTSQGWSRQAAGTNFPGNVPKSCIKLKPFTVVAGLEAASLWQEWPRESHDPPSTGPPQRSASSVSHGSGWLLHYKVHSKATTATGPRSQDPYAHTQWKLWRVIPARMPLCKCLASNNNSHYQSAEWRTDGEEAVLREKTQTATGIFSPTFPGLVSALNKPLHISMQAIPSHVFQQLWLFYHHSTGY